MGHGAPSFLPMLHIFIMNLRRNTAAGAAEVTRRCMRSPSDASSGRIAGFLCSPVAVGPGSSRKREKARTPLFQQQGLLA